MTPGFQPLNEFEWGDSVPRDRVYDALRQSERRMRIALDNLPGIFLIHDANLRIKYLNPAGLALSDLQLEEVLGKSAEEIYPPETTDAYLPYLLEAHFTKKPVLCETVIPMPNGNRLIITMNFIPVLDAEGTLQQVLVIGNNLTEQKEALAARERSDEQFRRLADNLPGLVYICRNDPDLTVLYMSANTERITGYTSEEFMAKNPSLAETVHPDDLEESLATALEAVEQRKSYEVTFRIRHKSGHWLRVKDYGAGFYTDGKLDFLQGYISDITEEERERETEEIFAQFAQDLSAADTMEVLTEATIQTINKLWTWDALYFSLRKSGQGLARTLAEIDTIDGVKKAYPNQTYVSMLTDSLKEGKPSLELRQEETITTDRFGDTSRGSMSLIHVPVVIGDKAIGVLSIQSYERNFYSESDVALLQKLTRIVAPALERCRAEERSRAFSTLGGKLAAATTPHEAAEIIVSVADELVGWDSCLLQLYNARENRVSHLVRYDLIDGERRKLDFVEDDFEPKALVLRALKEEQVLILRDKDLNVDPGSRMFGSNRPSASIIWVTIRNPQGITALLSIQSYAFQAYDQEDVDVIQALGNHCSSALDRTHAQNTLTQREERYRHAISAAGAVPYQLDYATQRYTFVGEGILQMTGWAADEFTTEIFRQMVKEAVVEGAADSTAYKRYVSEVRDQHIRNWKADIRIVTRWGEERWLSDTSIELPGEHGSPGGSLGILQDITERKTNETQLLHSALHDPLTGLANRALLLDHLQHALHRAHRRTSYQFAVLFVDIDRFKNINDSMGHIVGDGLLVTLAHRLQQCVRPGDTVARFAGDEFVLLLDDLSCAEDAIPVAERVLADISQPVVVGTQEIFTSASIGISISSAHYIEPAEMLRDADNALYRAKARGRARFAVFDASMHEHAVTLLELESDLRRAIERKELMLVYQPIIDLTTGRISHFEALVRWKHPTRGVISPLDFIPVAEENGMIIPIGYWIAEEAARQLKEWQREFRGIDLRMSINLSVRQVSLPELDQELFNIMQRVEINPSSIMLEITESTLMEKQDVAVDLLNRLIKLGFHLALDDFGTGYSSLSYLHQFPIGTLKIDRSFIHRMEQGGSEQEIVRSILVLAENLKMGTVAEGVETEEQLEILREMKCQCVQGFHLAKPMSATDATELIATSPRW